MLQSAARILLAGLGSALLFACAVDPSGQRHEDLPTGTPRAVAGPPSAAKWDHDAAPAPTVAEPDAQAVPPRPIAESPVARLRDARELVAPLLANPFPATAANRAELAYRAIPGTTAAYSEEESSGWESPAADRERYAHTGDNPLRLATEHPVSTFSIDVDTGAYANVRRFLSEGRLPHQDAVRVEELINYFDFDYPGPEDRATPFRLHTTVAPTPWNRATHLLRVGIKGFEVELAELPPANLVFLVDVSGSMQSDDKLGLLKRALEMLARQLRPRDRVAIAVYAGAAGVLLEPVSGADQARIRSALSRLRAGGSTNGGAGIELAYALARESFVPDGINRVILATDGDFNVGTVSFEALIDRVERERGSGIALTTLGFGTGNYNDHLMEQLADAGDGNYAYVDTLSEARKVLVEELSSTLHTIAQDVKIQIEFNPSVVAEYRLIGYENRILAAEDFNNDRVDAGDIGAGHNVTALYEIALADGPGRRLDPLRYAPPAEAGNDRSGEIAWIRLRYKRPAETASRLVERAVRRDELAGRLDDTDDDFRFAAAVAAFGQLLRGGRYTESFDYDDVGSLARTARGTDRFGYRSEFVRLVELAASLAVRSSARSG